MTGAVRLSTTLDLPPGQGDIADRLRLDGKFGIGAAQFANAETREKLEKLSRRGLGKPQDEDAGSAVSALRGSFVLRDGQMTLRDLTFAVTGAKVELAGATACAMRSWISTGRCASTRNCRRRSPDLNHSC